MATDVELGVPPTVTDPQLKALLLNLIKKIRDLEDKLSSS